MNDDSGDMPHNVVNIGDYLFEKRDTSYGRVIVGGVSETVCTHPSLWMDSNGQIVSCKDCGKQVSAYWALERCLNEYRRRWNELNRKARAQSEIATKTLRLKAARAMDKAWQRRGSVPSCPHCDRGIFPTDRFGTVGKALELEARASDPPDKWSGVAQCEVVSAFEKAIESE